MRRIYFLVFAALALLFCACGNKGGNNPANSQQKLIVGKWNLQKQNSTLFVDGVQQRDTTVEASNTGFSYVQFNESDKFTSVSRYNSGGIGSNSPGSTISVDTIRGTYGFSGLLFSLSAPALAGFSTGSVTAASGQPSLVHLVSQSAGIVQLTTSVLTLHVEYTTTQAVDSNTKTYKRLIDYYYTR